MAQSSTAAAGQKKPPSLAITKLQSQIHTKLKGAKGQKMSEEHIFSAFKDIDVKQMKSSLGGLVRLKLVGTSKDGDVMNFQWKDPALIKASAANTPEMNLCLMKIRESGNKGVSAKAIRHGLGQETSQPALRKALEALEKSGQIDQFKSIGQPTLPLYIMHNVKPAPELLGGIWYDGNKEYDAGLVDGVCRFLLNKVREYSLPSKRTKRSAEAKKLVAHPVFVHSRTPTFLTPTRLVKMVKDAKLTGEKIGIKEVMECMRALELDGLVEIVKPMGGIIDDAEPISGEDDDDGRAAKRRKGNDEESVDEEAEERARERRKEKERRAKKKEKERKEKAAKKKAKEKEKAKKKAKEKKRKEKAKKKAKRDKVGLGGANRPGVRRARADEQKKRKGGSDSEESDYEENDSDALVGIDDAETGDAKKKKSKKSSSKKRRRDSTSSSGSSSDSDSSDSDSDSGSASDSSSSSSSSSSSASSLDSNNLDSDSAPTKRKKRTKEIDLVVIQDSVFGSTAINNLDDSQVVYRATNRYKMPLAQDQVPCGRCPQFQFCEGDGPVNPDDCPYFEDWLANEESGWDLEAKRKYGLGMEENPDGKDGRDGKEGAEGVDRVGAVVNGMNGNGEGEGAEEFDELDELNDGDEAMDD